MLVTVGCMNNNDDTEEFFILPVKDIFRGQKVFFVPILYSI